MQGFFTRDSAARGSATFAAFLKLLLLLQVIGLAAAAVRIYTEDEFIEDRLNVTHSKCTTWLHIQSVHTAKVLYDVRSGYGTRFVLGTCSKLNLDLLLGRCPRIEHLVMDGCYTEMPAMDPVGYAALYRLELRNNHVSVLPAYAFRGLRMLATLLAPNNRFKTVDKEAFDGLVNLKRLDLSNNFIEFLDPATFGLTPRLTDLSLADNRLTTVPPLVGVLSLDISNNDPDFDFECINDQLDLVALVAHNTRTLNFSSYITATNLSLQSLDLSNSPDLDTDYMDLSILKNLHELKMNNCNLTQFNMSSIRNLVLLYALQLNNNQLRTFDAAAFRAITPAPTQNVYLINNSFDCSTASWLADLGFMVSHGPYDDTLVGCHPLNLTIANIAASETETENRFVTHILDAIGYGLMLLGGIVIFVNRKSLFGVLRDIMSSLRSDTTSDDISLENFYHRIDTADPENPEPANTSESPETPNRHETPETNQTRPLTL